MAIWLFVGFFNTPPAYFTKNALRFIIFFQFFPRLYLVYKLLEKIVKSTGVVTKTAWAGAAYNLALYILASHVSPLDSRFYKVKISIYIFRVIRD